MSPGHAISIARDYEPLSRWLDFATGENHVCTGEEARVLLDNDIARRNPL